MEQTVTFRIEKTMARLLDDVARGDQKPRSEVVREALRRYLAVRRFERLRRRILPFAEAAGFLTDEDVFRKVS